MAKKPTPGNPIFDYPVKVAPGDTRIVKAVRRDDGSIRILPPKRPRVIVEPTVNTTIPNPRILAAVAPVARNLVLQAAKAGDPEPYVYGYKAVRPLVVSGDDDGENLVLDLLWSVGPIEEIEGPYLYIPDVGIVSTATGSPTLHEHFLGTVGQAASTIMTALKGSYGAQAGRAHSVVSMQLGWNLNLMGFIYGRHITDPRTSPFTVAYSSNPALILADVLTLCGYTMDWPSVAEAANYCDELIGSPGAKRWEIGAVIRDRHDLSYWVHALAQYCQCYVDIRGGYAILVKDAPRSSNHTITAASILEGSERLNRRGSRDAPEAVTVIFKSYIDRTFPKTYGTANGSGTVSQLQMPFWNDFARAGRKAEETYRKANNEIESLEFIGFDDGLIRTLGDVGTITLPSVGLSSQLMAMTENEPVSRGRWRRKYIEYDATNYTDAVYSGSSTQVELNNPYAPPAGPTPVLVCDLVTTESPNWTRIKIDFSPITWAYLESYYVTVTTTTDLETILYSEEIPKGAETGSPETITTYTDFHAAVNTSPLTTYRVNVYVRSIVDALSAAPGTADYAELLWDGDPMMLWYPTETTNAIPEIRFRTASLDSLGVSVARYTYINFPNGNEWLEFMPFIEEDYGAGEYLVSYAITSLVSGAGSVLVNGSAGTPGAWYDANGLLIELADFASPATREHVVLAITVAKDAGGGTPVACSQKTKTVTIIAYRAAYGYTVEDTFTGTNGTALAAHTPDVDSVAGGWVTHAGGFTIQTNRAQAAPGSPIIESRAVIDAGTASCCIMAELKWGSEDAGLIGRAQDASNYWELRVLDADTANPMLQLNEVSAGTPTTRASVTMTGEGPFSSLSDRPLRLMFDGNDIFGYCKNEHSLTRYEVTYTSATFNTATLFGILSSGTATTWDEVHITTAEIGLIT